MTKRKPPDAKIAWKPRHLRGMMLTAGYLVGRSSDCSGFHDQQKELAFGKIWDQQGARTCSKTSPY